MDNQRLLMRLRWVRRYRGMVHYEDAETVFG
jgi:hypothetical protein